MMSQETPGRTTRGSMRADARPRRSALVTVLGLLLLLQSAVLFGVGVYDLSRAAAGPAGLALDELTSFVGGTIALLAPLTLAAAVNFLARRRGGWLLAVLSQGIGLVLALVLYSRGEPWYVYPVLAFHIVMVLYLNVDDVQAVFGAGSERARRERS